MKIPLTLATMVTCSHKAITDKYLHLYPWLPMQTEAHADHKTQHDEICMYLVLSSIEHI